MRKRKDILLFIIVISISMFVVGLSYSIVSHHLTPEYIARQFLVNLPFGIALGFADWWIISRVYRQRLFRSNAMRVVVDILLTTIVSAVVTACLNYLILWGENSIFIVVANSFAVVPCNWIIVLQIELYIYHQQQAATARQLEIIEKERTLYQFEVLKNQINPISFSTALTYSPRSPIKTPTRQTHLPKNCRRFTAIYCPPTAAQR